METKETEKDKEKKGMPVVPIFVTLLLIGAGVFWFMSSNPQKKEMAVALSNEENHNEEENHEDEDGHGHDEGEEGHGSEEEGHDEHGGHDEHEEEGIKLSEAEMKEFGIKLAKADAGTLSRYVSLPGEVRANEDQLVHIGPRIPGVVRKVRKTVGDTVRAGEIIAVLESKEMGEAKIAYFKTKTEIDISEANLEIARAQVDVGRTKRDVALDQVKVVRTAVEAAKSQVTVAENNLKVTRINLETEKNHLNIAETNFKWQKTVHDNTKALLAKLTETASLESISKTFEGRAVGGNRARLINAYADLNFAEAAFKREKDLWQKKISSESEYLNAKKDYEKAKSTSESIHEEVAFQNRIALMEKEQLVKVAAQGVKRAEQETQIAEQAIITAEQAVKAAEQSLKAAQQNVTVEEQSLNIVFKNMGLTEKNLELSRSEVRAAEGRLRIDGITRQELKKLREKKEADGDIALYLIRSPQKGVVIEKHITLGEALDAYDKSFVVADLSNVWVDLSVYQKDLPFVAEGQEVLIEAGKEHIKTMGKIAYVGPVVGEETRTALARIVIANKEGKWRPGLFINAKIAVGEINLDLIVPKSAIQKMKNKAVLFVMEHGELKPQPVKLGRSDERYVEITEGINWGDTYVVEGGFTLRAQLGKGELGDGHNH